MSESSWPVCREREDMQTPREEENLEGKRNVRKPRSDLGGGKGRENGGLPAGHLKRKGRVSLSKRVSTPS